MRQALFLTALWGLTAITGVATARAGSSDWGTLFQRLRQVDERACPYTVGTPGDLVHPFGSPDPGKANRSPAVVSVEPVEMEPVNSEVKLKLDCPQKECEISQRAELLKLFKEKVNAKKIWLYDFADKRLKDQVTIRKRNEKGQTLLTVKLKNVVPAGATFEEATKQMTAIYQKYLAGQPVKGNKCEQDWNESDRDRSPFSCSFTVALTAEQEQLKSPNAQNLLTDAQREFIREYKKIDLRGVEDAFAEPAYFDAEERKLLADSEVSVETWVKPGADGKSACYAFEISTKVPTEQAADKSKRLNDLIAPYVDAKSTCPLIKSAEQNRTKSM